MEKVYCAKSGAASKNRVFTFPVERPERPTMRVQKGIQGWSSGIGNVWGAAPGPGTLT